METLEVRLNGSDIASLASETAGRCRNAGFTASALRETCTRAAELISLRASVVVYPIEICGEYAVLHSGNGLIRKIHIGPRAEYLKPADEAVVAICTAGSAITGAIERLAEAGDEKTRHVYEVFGILSLEKIASRTVSYAESRARAKGWGAGPLMQPGSATGWDIEGQRDLCLLGRADAIGVSIGASPFLIPYISSSALIGIGPGYCSGRVSYLCRECPLADSCLWRKDRQSLENGPGRT